MLVYPGVYLFMNLAAFLPRRKSKYIPWRELLRRTFAIDIKCRRCHGDLRLIAPVKTEATMGLASDGMKLPAGSKAVVEIDKLRSYCLNASHPRGRHKARVFAAAIGLTASDAPELRATLLRVALENDATPLEADEYGERYFVDFWMIRAARRARIRSSWIILRGDSVPRLTSCYVL